MGYRSNIAFCLSVNEENREDKDGTHSLYFDRDKFKEMVGFFKLTKFYEIAIGEEYDLLNQKEPHLGWDDGRIVFHAEDWKWYSEYPLVIAYNEMWESMQDIEGISGYFLRVGEGDGNQMDVDEDEFGDDPDYHLFAPYAGMSFDGENFLGKTNTEENLTMLETKEM
jgi:hypothetical protein